MDNVGKFKTGEPVYIQAAGRSAVVSMIFPFKDPQFGKVTKVSQVEVEGGKTSSVDIETDDGKTLTAMVPGKMNGKRFVPDSVLMNMTHSMKPGTEVQVTTRDDNGKTYLVEIARAPKTTPKPASAASDNNMTNSKAGKGG
jgi:translation initiation factor IF-1